MEMPLFFPRIPHISPDDIIQVRPRDNSEKTNEVSKIKIYTEKDASTFHNYYWALKVADKLSPSNSSFKLDAAGDYTRARFSDDTDPVISLLRKGDSYGEEVPGER